MYILVTHVAGYPMWRPNSITNLHNCRFRAVQLSFHSVLGKHSLIFPHSIHHAGLKAPKYLSSLSLFSHTLSLFG